MEIGELTSLLPFPGELITQLLKAYKPLFELEAYKDYDVLFHKVNQHKYRKDKIVNKPNGTKNANGQDNIDRVKIPVARIAIPFQKLIVETTATFLTGGKFELKASPKNEIEQRMLDAVKTMYKRNKLDFRNGVLAECMMSQTEVAELWFSDVDEDGKPVMKMKVIQPADGFELHPIFDGIGNLIAFGIYWTENKTQYYDLYTKDELRKHVNNEGTSTGWVLVGSDDKDGLKDAEEGGGDGSDDTIDDTAGGLAGVIKLPYGKIPIIYYAQDRSEWYDVQSMIDRLETMQSNHGDTNDYSGSPILAASGNVKGFADKGEPGKFIQLEQGATLQYVVPESAPESMKLEFENLKNLIHLCTQVPDLSLQSLKGLGQIPSGAAFERLLLATYMKVRRKQKGAWGEATQRRINFMMRAAVSLDATLKPALDMDITPDFGIFQIDDIADRIHNALNANGQEPIMSQEESIVFAGLSDDPAITYKKIKDEKAALGNVFDNPPSGGGMAGA